MNRQSIHRPGPLIGLVDPVSFSLLPLSLSDTVPAAATVAASSSDRGAKMTGQDFFPHPPPAPPPLPSVSVCVKTPGAPPLASYLSLPPATWLNGTLTPRHAESESHFPVWDGGGFHVASPPIKTFFTDSPLAPSVA